MATPSNPQPGKRPTGPSGKPPVPASKPAQGARPQPGAAKPAAKPPAKPAAAGRPAAGGANRPQGRAAPKIPKLAQVLVDLGYVEDEQVPELLAEAKSTGQTVGKVALDQGLITEDQLLAATAEEHGMKVVNLEETKPHP